MEAEKKKAKVAMEKGDMEIAKIHAESSIRLKKEAIGTRRYGAKMGALASKLDGAVRA
jgi:charged multivesicular body protein 1